jgi:adenylate kinase
MQLVMLGPPGAGKSTQAQRAAAKYGVPHLSAGALLRAAVASDTPAGALAKDAMARGDLVPDDIVQAIVFERLGGLDTHNGFILDGFPRTIAQALALDRFLKDRGLGLSAVIELKAKGQVLLERIAARNANAVARREPQRIDDNAEVLRSRIEAYHRQTAPLIDYYRRKGVLHSIDGMLPIFEVEQEIDRIAADLAIRKGRSADA